MDWGRIQSLILSLKALGVQRLVALGIAATMVAGLIAAGSYFATKSGFETLYVGLTPQDISRMGSALSDAGIPFDSSLDGTKIGVPLGQASAARALLAEKGLPGSPNSGYELFDKVGALGLTSFMQEITRVRALEGELARTVQHIKGIRGARVHLVLPDAGTMRSKKQPPSASVIVSSNVSPDAAVVAAIRHVVASAIPEMTPDLVSIVGTDGKLLSSTGGVASESSSKMIELEKQFAERIQDNIRRTLIPYFGQGNFEVSALARLNIDKRQMNETAFDPDKRVERSVRVVKEAENSQARSGSTSVSVEQNIPNEAASGSGNEQTKRAQDRKEETTNYEISSKSATTMSDGYRIENLSVSIVVNRKRVAEIIGKEPAEDDIKTKLAEIEDIVKAAAGIDKTRGDSINVSAVNFIADTITADASEGGEWVSTALSLSGVLIKSLTVIGVVAIVVMAGFKPLTRALLNGAPQAAISGPGESSLDQPSLMGLTNGAAPLDMPQMASPLLEGGNDPFGSLAAPDSEYGGGRSMAQGPIEKLMSLLDHDEDHAAAVLKHWVRTG
ncbi:MAG: flagellar basal-body MS-ring/collar protein FliF [Hyphomicrobium sp.]